ncbi:MAG: T9SS type A sorting domain-containing protein [Bacteroidales bacterium]|nr:T9SS type A sorting domain-containing protein [Bacteroidales bacterium]
MTLTAIATVDGVQQGNEAVEIAVFAGNEIRGKAFTQSTEYEGTTYYYAPITIQGEGEEELSFKMYNHETEEGDDYICNFTMDFESNETYGEANNPKEIPFYSSTQYPTHPFVPVEGSTGLNATGYFWIQLNGQDITDNNRWDLGVFSGDVCRGQCDEYIEASTYKWYNTIINGNANEELSFLLYDLQNGRYYTGVCETTITYSDQANYGSIPNPIILNFVAPYVFNGSDSDHSWSTTSNWNEPEAGLPSETDEVTIKGYCELGQDITVNNIIVKKGKTLKVMPGKTLTLTEGIATTEASQLILTDDAQLIDANHSAVPASYMLTVSGYESNENNWYLFGSPFSDSIAGTDFPTGDYDLYWYDETNQTHEEWRNYKQATGTSFTPGVGYLYANKADQTPSVGGTLNYNNVEVSMTHTDRTYDDLDGLNLLANPFPYAITMANFTNTKLSDGFYFLESGAWSSQSSSTSIKTGQAFLIGCTEANTVTFQAAVSTSTRGNDNTSSIKVNIDNGDKADHAYIILNEGNDLIKIAHRSQDIPEVYIPMNNKAYAIAHFAKDTETVTVAYVPTQNGQQTLSVELEGSYEYLTLTDNLTGAVVNLLDTPSYTFDANTNDMTCRFTLRFKANTEVNDNAAINPISYRQDGRLTVNGEGQLQIIDMLGRIVSSTTINGNYSQMIDNTPGVYVVRLVSEGNTYTQKIVVE